MLPIYLAKANPALVKRWQVITGTTIGLSGVASIPALVPMIRELIPSEMLVEAFIYMAVATAFVTGLPLLLFPRVLTLSFAQLGVATSIMLLARSVAGAFPATYMPFFRIILGVVAIVLGIVFGSSLLYAFQQKSWSDLTLGSILLLVFAGLWLYCIFIT